MKRFVTLVFAMLLVCGMADAINYNEVTITSSSNRLLNDIPQIGTASPALLPTDFNDVLFDGATPRMDRVFVFMTMPAGMSDYTVTDPAMKVRMVGSSLNTYHPTVTIQGGDDMLFSFVREGSQYVLDRLPFDPTVWAMDSIIVPAATTMKVYVTGKMEHRISAQLPEQVGIVMRPYLEGVRQMLSDMIVGEVKSAITSMGITDLSLNKNTEGFFFFTGGKSSVLDLYVEDLSIGTKAKTSDFLGGIVGGMNLANLMPLDQEEDESILGDLTGKTDGEIADLLSALAADDYGTMSVAQITAVAHVITAEQISYLTPRQICALLGVSDIAEALSMSTTDIGNTLYGIFGDAGKASAAGNILANLQSNISSLLSSQLSAQKLKDALLEMGYSKLFSSLVQGTASPFAFASNSDYIESQAFNIRVHSKGENTIIGGAEASFKNVGSEMTALAASLSSNPDIETMITDLGTIFETVIKFTSAPLAVRPSAKTVDKDSHDAYSYTVSRFIFDDVWTDGAHTNGLLQLPVEGEELGAPSIDLGTPNGQAIFNSGRYKFHTPVSNKKKNMFYVATMAICYRELAVTMPLASKDITYAGIGTSVGWGPAQNRNDNYRNVIINDGTFYTYSAEAWKDPARGDNAVDAVGNGWYVHYTDLRLPYNTSILGGTFPYDTYVYRCDAAAEHGVDPVYIYQPTPMSTPQYTSLCIRKEVPAPSISSTYVAAQTTPVVVDASHEDELLFTVNGTSEKWNYGHQGMVADPSGILYLYVPGNCRVDYTYVRNYVTALAPFGEYHMSTKMMSMGGDVEVKSLYQDNVNFKMKNAYLLYTQLGYYTFTEAGVNLGGLKRTLQDEFQIDRAKHHNFKKVATQVMHLTEGQRNRFANIETPNIETDYKYLIENPSDYIKNSSSGQRVMLPLDTTGVIFSDITNANTYTIEYGIYSMLPAKSDEWMMVSMPYDVANVYILETTDEQADPSWTIKEADDAATVNVKNINWSNYYRRQGKADGDMAQTLVTSVLPDVFSGRGSGVLQPLPYILNNLTNEKTKVTKLKHWDGKSLASMKTANYYLRRQLPDYAGTRDWNKQDTVGAYGYRWVYAPEYTTPTDDPGLYQEDPDCTCDFWDDECVCDQLPSQYTTQDGTVRPPAEQRVIMKKDSVYSLYFPGGGKRFWAHKYLIFEGYGPQRISGKNIHSGFAHPDPDATGFYHPGADKITLQGNTTFRNDTIRDLSDDHPLFFVEKHADGAFFDPSVTIQTKNITYDFVASKGKGGEQSILPTDVYMVTDNNKAVNRETMVSSPNIVWSERNEYNDSNVPTLADGLLTAWTDKGIYIYSFLGQDIAIYTLDGRTLWSGRIGDNETRFIPAATGVYLVKGQTGVMKVINE